MSLDHSSFSHVTCLYLTALLLVCLSIRRMTRTLQVSIALLSLSRCLYTTALAITLRYMCDASDRVYIYIYMYMYMMPLMGVGRGWLAL